MWSLFVISCILLHLFGVLGQLSQTQIDSILAAHNNLRAEKCVPPVTWSTSLAAQAQSWSNGCSFSHGVDFSSVGENIAWGSNNLPGLIAYVWVDPEKPQYTCGQPYGNPVFHYTAMMWNRTTQIGCGLSQCSSPFLVCRYLPAGNSGAPAWRCPTQCGAPSPPPAPITSAPLTTRPITSARLTTSALTSAPLTTSALTSSPLTTSPVTSARLTTSPVTSAPLTTSPVTSAPLTTRDVATPAPVTTSRRLTTRLITSASSPSSEITTGFSPAPVSTSVGVSVPVVSMEVSEEISFSQFQIGINRILGLADEASTISFYDANLRAKSVVFYFTGPNARSNLQNLVDAVDQNSPKLASAGFEVSDVVCVANCEAFPLPSEIQNPGDDEAVASEERIIGMAKWTAVGVFAGFGVLIAALIGLAIYVVIIRRKKTQGSSHGSHIPLRNMADVHVRTENSGTNPMFGKTKTFNEPLCLRR
eukprot:TRINITY_DN4777_c1_g1_i2.p1 TRINITY_DN4777_c1_g1~~TRINITY_DN4777_c1_g1_i2.p1  ORF type:complete len:475 (-),score=55.39 TRINITY_DN4777_c1_g1_i2:193-1617(-)